VTKILEAVHALTFYTLGEQRSWAENAAANPYAAMSEEAAPEYLRITCGHNPILEARLVRNLTVIKLADADGLVERASWEEQMVSGGWERESISQRFRSPAEVMPAGPPRSR
jgi:hypothetical protein